MASFLSTHNLSLYTVSFATFQLYLFLFDSEINDWYLCVTQIPAGWVLAMAPHFYAMHLAGNSLDRTTPRMLPDVLKNDQTLDSAVCIFIPSLYIYIYIPNSIDSSTPSHSSHQLTPSTTDQKHHHPCRRRPTKRLRKPRPLRRRHRRRQHVTPPYLHPQHVFSRVPRLAGRV